MSSKVEPFVIDVPQKEVEDLLTRIRQTRWPDEIEGQDWKYGTPKSFLKDLAEYWYTHYDWKAKQAELNSNFKHFTAHNVNGIRRLHFLHHRSPRADARPLLLTHGWPGSFFEFHKLIPLLMNPGPDKPAFHLVVPSLPGFGFSSAPATPGFGVKAMAATLNELMLTLGYDSYYAQGGDWGSHITRALGVYHAENCKAIHINTNLSVLQWYNPLHWAQYFNALYFPQYAVFANKHDIGALQFFLDFQAKGFGYQDIQSTRPQTLGYAMNDSPVGLLSWLAEKFYTWTDTEGDLYNYISKDEVLTDVSIYWFTQSATSSFRIYYESRAKRETVTIPSLQCKVPVGIASYLKDHNTPEGWAKATMPRLRSYHRFEHGGHFAALEQTDSLLHEIQTFFTDKL